MAREYFDCDTSSAPPVVVPCVLCGRPVDTIAGALDSLCLRCACREEVYPDSELEVDPEGA